MVLLAEQVIEHLERGAAVARERATVQETLSTLRARLEGIINANRLLVHGLNAVIASQPDLGQAGFERIARGLVDERNTLRHIAGAPGLVVSLLYPRAGNEAALGLDYRTHPIQGPRPCARSPPARAWWPGPCRSPRAGWGSSRANRSLSHPPPPGSRRGCGGWSRR